jgi:hypothetical protein
MDIDYTKVYQNINLSFIFGGGLIKFFTALILFAMVFYTFMLILKVRVLQDTVEVSPAGFAKTILAINLLVTLAGSIIAFVLILL